MTDESNVRTAILTVISLLVRREYLALANMTGNLRYTAEMLERAVTEYGRTLRMPPDNDPPPDLEILAEDVHPERLHAVMSLWTEEEGESDLGLEMTLIVNPRGFIDVQVDGVHVL